MQKQAARSRGGLSQARPQTLCFSYTRGTKKVASEAKCRSLCRSNAENGPKNPHCSSYSPPSPLCDVTRKPVTSPEVIVARSSARCLSHPLRFPGFTAAVLFFVLFSTHDSGQTKHSHKHFGCRLLTESKMGSFQPFFMELVAL